MIKSQIILKRHSETTIYEYDSLLTVLNPLAVHTSVSKQQDNEELNYQCFIQTCCFDFSMLVPLSI